VSNWVLPRSKWADMEKNNASSQKVIDAALANGTIFRGRQRGSLDSYRTRRDALRLVVARHPKPGVLSVLGRVFTRTVSATNATFAKRDPGTGTGSIVSRFYNYKSGP